MTWIEFIQQCDKTMLPNCQNEAYLNYGLTAEAGEVCGVMAKFIRGDFDTKELKKRLVSELGDCLWFIAMKSKYYEACVDQGYLDTKVTKSIDGLVDVIVNGSDVDISLKDLLSYIDVNECVAVVLEKLEGRLNAGTIQGDGEGVDR